MDDFDQALDKLCNDQEKLWNEIAKKRKSNLTKARQRVQPLLANFNGSTWDDFISAFDDYCKTVRDENIDPWLVKGDLIFTDFEVSCHIVLTGAHQVGTHHLHQLWERIINRGGLADVKKQMMDLFSMLDRMTSIVPPIPMLTQQELFSGVLGISRGQFRGQLNRGEWKTQFPVDPKDRSKRLRSSQKRFWTHQDFSVQLDAIKKFREVHNFGNG